jgi:hypothetical protein
MNNEPVAYVNSMCNDYIDWKVEPMSIDGQSLYTHPVKELKNIVVASATCSCGKVMEVTNLQPVKELTDEEINKLWAESHEDGIAMQQGFNTQQHYFAHLILRKAQE